MTVAVALIAAVLAGALGAWVSARHDRRERFRDRMIDAADDYVQALAEALHAELVATRLALVAFIGDFADTNPYEEGPLWTWAYGSRTVPDDEGFHEDLMQRQDEIEREIVGAVGRWLVSYSERHASRAA